MAQEDQRWAVYSRSMLLFNFMMFLLVYAVLLMQGNLPLNPDRKMALEPSLGFHTAVSRRR